MKDGRFFNETIKHAINMLHNVTRSNLWLLQLYKKSGLIGERVSFNTIFFKKLNFIKRITYKTENNIKIQLFNDVI